MIASGPIIINPKQLKMRKIYLMSIAVLSLWFSDSMAQQHSISGTVKAGKENVQRKAGYSIESITMLARVRKSSDSIP